MGRTNSLRTSVHKASATKWTKFFQLHLSIGEQSMAGRGAQIPPQEQLNRVLEAVKQLFEKRAENLKFVDVNGYVISVSPPTLS